MEPMMAFALILAYMAPFLVSIARGLDAPFAFLFANLLGGATVLGWFVVLYVALTAEAPGTPAPRRERRRADAQPALHVQHIYNFDRPTLVSPVFVMPQRAQDGAAQQARPSVRALASDRWPART